MQSDSSIVDQIADIEITSQYAFMYKCRFLPVIMSFLRKHDRD
jgi:hypothetical protein